MTNIEYQRKLKDLEKKRDKKLSKIQDKYFKSYQKIRMQYNPYEFMSRVELLAAIEQFKLQNNVAEFNKAMLHLVTGKFAISGVEI